MLHAKGSKMSDSQICDLFISMEGANPSATEVMQIMANPEEHVTQDKFVTAMMRLQKQVKKVKDDFGTYDKDGSGFLDKKEILDLLKNGYGLTEEKAKEYAKTILEKDDA